jgi:hypothetical protein
MYQQYKKGPYNLTIFSSIAFILKLANSWDAFPLLKFMGKLLPETHIKRQATRQDCLPSLLGYGDKLIEIVQWKKINILY